MRAAYQMPFAEKLQILRGLAAGRTRLESRAVKGSQGIFEQMYVDRCIVFGGICVEQPENLFQVLAACNLPLDLVAVGLPVVPAEQVAHPALFAQLV